MICCKSYYTQYLLQMSCCPSDKEQVIQKPQKLPPKPRLPQNSTHLNGQMSHEIQDELRYLSSEKALFVIEFTKEVQGNFTHLKRMLNQMESQNIEQVERKYRDLVNFTSVEKYFSKSKYQGKGSKGEDTTVSHMLMQPYTYVISLAVSNKTMFQDIKYLLEIIVKKLKKESLQEYQTQNKMKDRLQKMDKIISKYVQEIFLIIEGIIHESKVNKQKQKEDQVQLYKHVIIPKITFEMEKMKDLFIQQLKKQMKGQLKNTEINIGNLLNKNSQINIKEKEYGQHIGNQSQTLKTEPTSIQEDLTQNQDLRNKCSEKDIIIGQMKTEYQMIKHQKQKMINFEIPSLQKANNELTEQINLLKGQQLQLNTVIEGHEKMARQLSDKANNIDKQNQQLLKQVKELNSLVSTYEVEVLKLKNNIMTLQTQLQQYKKNRALQLSKQVVNSSLQQKEESFEYLTRLQDLQSSSIRYQSETSKLKMQLESLSTECFSYRVENKDKEGQIQRLKNMLNSTQEESLKVRQTVQDMKQQNSRVKSQYDKLSIQKIKIQELMQINEQKMSKANNQLQEQKQSMAVKLVDAQKKVTMYESQVLKIKESLQFRKLELQQSRKQNQNLKNMNAELKEQNQKLISQKMMSESLRSNQEYQNIEAKYKQQLRLKDELLKETNQRYKEIEKQKEQQIENLKTNNNKNKNETLQKQNQDLTIMINQVKRQNQLLKQQIQNLKKYIEDILIQLKQSKNLVMDLSKKLDGLRNNTRLRTKSFVQHVTLFGGKILEKRKSEKRFLIESIERHMSRIIQKTEFLYSFQRDSKINFHERIDNLSHLVVVVQTTKAIFAGYYSGKYMQKVPMTEQGLLISLTNYKSYMLNNQRNYPRKDKTKPVYGMIYDKFYLIVGNSQIRIKAGQKQKKVFSNFGVSNSYFNSHQDKINTLICEGEKVNQVDFINYQLYQVVFDSQLQFVQ